MHRNVLPTPARATATVFVVKGSRAVEYVLAILATLEQVVKLCVLEELQPPALDTVRAAVLQARARAHRGTLAQRVQSFAPD